MNLLGLINIHHKVILLLVSIIAMGIAYFYGEKMWSYCVAAFFVISRFFDNQIFGFESIFPQNKLLFIILTFLEFAIIISSLFIGMGLSRRNWVKKELLKIPIFAGLGTAAIYVIMMIIK